jgi:hypothetical protein
MEKRISISNFLNAGLILNGEENFYLQLFKYREPSKFLWQNQAIDIGIM